MDRDRRINAVAWAALTLTMAAIGCGASGDDRDGSHIGDTPGSSPWHDGDDVACVTSDDCASGEACEDGVCVMARCMDSYTSAAPLGKSIYFGLDAEVTVISDDTWIDAFEGSDGSYLSSWNLSDAGDQIVDVAGGNLMGERPQTIAVAVAYSDVVRFSGPAPAPELNVGIWPKTLATGDVDADGLDELIAFAEDGTISVCDVDEMTCHGAGLDGVGKDVAAGDIDDDGFAEPLFLFETGGETLLVAWNHDAETTGQEGTLAWSLSFPARAFAAGDLDGDARAEVVLLEDGGWWGLANDKAYVFSPASEQIVASTTLDGKTLDVALGDRDADERDEIGVLRKGQIFELLSFADQQLTSLGQAPITVGDKATRISMVDWDGDSAFGKLQGGPELVAGESVPVAALYFPPYPHNVAKGALSAKITVGEVESTSETLSDTVSLTVGMGVSFGADVGIFKAKVGAKLDKNTSYTYSQKTKVSVGARYSLHASPELYGSEYAGVIMSCGCYHRYRYVGEDPAGLLGGDGQTFDVYVPVGGQTQLWSSRRYNAMAEASGKLPIIPVPTRVGDVGSYPTSLVTTEGQPIPEEDLVFPSLPSFQLSDVGYVSFHLSAGEYETNSESTTTTVGAYASFGAAGVGIDANASLGVSAGYSVTVGKDTLFSGSIPPVPDDPSTPEDEYEVHRYSFTPSVYRHHYVNPATQEPGAYYVMYYAVGA